MQTKKLFLDDAYAPAMQARIIDVSDKGVMLDQTVFYALSGGQPGDTGLLRFANQNVPILSTIKGDSPDQIWHQLPPDIAPPNIGEIVEGEIDWATRHKHMRMHTCLHLLCSLVVGDVTGGSVGADKGRLDFNIAADAVDKEDLTKKLNALIGQNHPVNFEWISDSALESNPHLIRTMSVKPPMGQGQVRLVRIGSPEHTVDLQPCGGTHVRTTGEIGAVEITKIENKGKQNRRISIAFAEG
jgi:misacylated tRNA(Ala) deacylase